MAQQRRDTSRLSQAKSPLIPTNTITSVENRPINIPFAGLRTWFFGLLALVMLPLGGLLALVGTVQTDALTADWIQTTATVSRVTDDVVAYRYSTDSGSETTQRIWISNLDNFIQADPFGGVNVKVSLCDIAAPILIPAERGATFTLWYNPVDPAMNQCVPVTEETSVIMIVIGSAMLLMSIWILLTTIGRAAAYRSLMKARAVQAQQRRRHTHSQMTWE